MAEYLTELLTRSIISNATLAKSGAVAEVQCHVDTDMTANHLWLWHHNLIGTIEEGNTVRSIGGAGRWAPSAEYLYLV